MSNKVEIGEAKNMSNNWFSRPCISPRGLSFWVFLALTVYPPLSRLVQRLDPAGQPGPAELSHTMWDLISSAGVALGIALVVALVASAGAYIRRTSNSVPSL